MPWNVKDVEEHKKGLSDSQKKKWVRIANGAFASCKQKGKEEKECAASAIKAANSMVGNASIPDYNLGLAILKHATIRTAFHDSRLHLVVPVVMLTEGVHNNRLYKSEDLAKFPESWNGRPVVVGHPEKEGTPVSVNESPELAEKVKIGTLFNTVYDKENKKLKSEAWIDVEKASSLNIDVLQAINSGSDVEVSTGLWMDEEESSGNWNGEQFEVVAINYKPDHLALLLNEKGACSISDGCGVRNNMMEVADGELCYTDIMDSLWRMVSMSKDGNPPMGNLRQVYSDYFTFENFEGNLLKQGYKVKKGGEVVFKGEAEKIKKLVSYETLVKKNKSFNKEAVMDKKEKVDFIMNTKSLEYKDEMKGVLEALSDEALELHVNLAKKFRECDCRKEEADKKEAEKALAKNTEKKEEVKKPITVQEYIADAPDDVKEVIANGVRIHNERKSLMIKSLVDNKRNKFTQERLSKMSLDELESLVALAQVDLDFSGQKGASHVVSNKNERHADGTGVPAAPEMTWEKPVNNNRARG